MTKRIFQGIARVTKERAVFCIMFALNKLCGVKNKVVFCSFGGKSYSDNPKAISEKLHVMAPHIQITWILQDPEKKKNQLPSYVHSVKSNTFGGLFELATAKAWVDNFPKSWGLYKDKKQLYIQTFHGDRGFKMIHLDSTINGQRPRITPEWKICDIMVSGSTFMERVFRSAFRYTGEFLKVGCPRNDQLLNVDTEQRKRIKSELRIKDDVQVLLYAPTLRRKAAATKTGQSMQDIDLIRTIQKLKEYSSQDWVCLVRAHSAVGSLNNIPEDVSVIDVSTYEDMADLLLISDMLVTDYSSSAGDFALRNLPIILFQSDRDEFLKKDREFYFDIDESPYIVAKSQDELESAIRFIMNPAKAAENCHDILAFYGAYETGRASEEVAARIISEMKG